MDELFRNFTPRAQKVMELTRKQAVRLNDGFVGTEHLLLALIQLGQGGAFSVFTQLGLDLPAVCQAVEREAIRGTDSTPIHFLRPTPRFIKVVELAHKERAALNHTYLGTEHLLFGLAAEADNVAARVLQSFNVDASRIHQHIVEELNPKLYPGESR